MRRTLTFPVLLFLGACAAGGAPPVARPIQPVPFARAVACEVPNEPTQAAPQADDDGYGRIEDPSKEGDFCETADTNLARAEARILEDRGGPPAAHAPWDHHARPERLDRVMRRLPLTRAERDMLEKNGFVALPERVVSNYADALHDVYQSELPIWISADAILHAVYASNDHLIADVERTVEIPLVQRALAAMQCAVASAPYPEETRRDLDLYLTVARSLLADAPVPSAYGADAEAAALVGAVKKAEGIGEVQVFGRPRVVDWSAYLPRGHYADLAPASPGDPAADAPADAPAASLAPFFRAAMFLSRFEYNVVSRSSRSSLLGSPDPSETPREAVDALALADLAARANVLGDVERLDRIWTLFAGRREDLTVKNLLDLRRSAGIATIDASSFEPLKAAIGPGFRRTARLHPMPEGSTDLPVIATLLGPRVVADTAAFRPLLHTEVPERRLVRPGDVAYVLGLDRGKAWLEGDLATFPTLSDALDRARAGLASAPDAGDLYGAWLSAVEGVAHAPQGALPSFMSTAAYDDLRMNSIVAGYGQLRHNYVLMAGQAYDEGGCEIPDGWIEPLPDVYMSIGRYAERGAAAMKEIDPEDRTRSGAYFAELRKVMRVMGVLVRHEIEGRALTDEEKRFLAMVAEMTPGSSGGPPTFTGWYFDLFRGRAPEALADASFVADYQTSAWTQRVQYAGAFAPTLGVFVVDVGGPPRVMVGPIARAYGLTGSTDQRYTDQSVASVPGKESPWAASYTPPSAPRLAVAGEALFPDPDAPPAPTRIVLRAAKAVAKATVEILDHHGAPVATLETSLPANKRVALTTRAVGEGWRVRVGDASAEGHATWSERNAVLASGVTLEPAASEDAAR
jgi:hypothetical protein